MIGQNAVVSREAARDTSVPVPEPLSARLAARFGPDVLVALATAGVTSAVVAYVFRLWRAPLNVPFGYDGDGVFFAAIVKSIVENGWFLENPDVGAPTGSHLRDYPQGADTLHWLIVRGLSLFLNDWAVVLNVFFLLSFPLAALTALFVLRRLGISRPAALVCAVLFALLPYHFYRGEWHLTFATYYAVPIGAYLALATVAGHSFFGLSRPVGSRTVAGAVGAVAGTLVLCAVAATGSAYYAGFTLLLVASAMVIAFIRRRQILPLVSGTLILVAILATLVVALAPSLAYRLENGSNPELERFHWETERLGVKLVRILIPVSGHRIPALRELTERYWDGPLDTVEQGESIGIMASVGLGFLLLGGLVALLGGSRAAAFSDRLRELSVMTFVALLISVSGGLAVLFALIVVPELRSWNRMSVFIAFFAFAALGLLIDAVRRRLSGSVRRQSAAAVFVVGVLGLGVFDQTPPGFTPGYRGMEAPYRINQRFVDRIEDALPDGASVFQLPSLEYPWYGGPGQRRIRDYDHLRAYLHSSTLQWSYGAVRGRAEGEWHSALLRSPLPQALPVLSALGFQGIYVDRAGYLDPAIEVENLLRTTLGVAAITSEDGRLAFFDMRDYNARVRRQFTDTQLAAVAEAALSPINLDWKSGFYDQEGSERETWRWAAAKATLWVENFGGPRDVVLIFRAGSPSGSGVWVTLPDGSRLTVPMQAGNGSLRAQFHIPAGRSELTFETDAPPLPPFRLDQRDTRVRIIDLNVYDAVFDSVGG